MNPADLLFQHVALHRGDFSFNVDTMFPAGKLTVVLGPSGCGKTTLLDLTAGFLSPENGRILAGETIISNLPPEERRVGVVFQDHALFPHMSVRRNVMYGPRCRGVSKKIAEGTADELLALVRMESYGRRRPESLSGGEKQRVALARALASEPAILLLDEPFSALDAALRRNMRREVRRIQRLTGITAVLVTHDQEEALAVADHLAVMDGGRIVETGVPERLWEEPDEIFTARFLGRNTLLAVRNAKREPDGRLHIETASGALEAPSRIGLATNESVLMIPPDGLVLDAQGLLSARVENVEYTGGGWRVSASPEGNGTGPAADRIILETKERPEFKTGAMIGLRADMDRIRLLTPRKYTLSNDR